MKTNQLQQASEYESRFEDDGALARKSQSAWHPCFIPQENKELTTCLYAHWTIVRTVVTWELSPFFPGNLHNSSNNLPIHEHKTIFFYHVNHASCLPMTLGICSKRIPSSFYSEKSRTVICNIQVCIDQAHDPQKINRPCAKINAPLVKDPLFVAKGHKNSSIGETSQLLSGETWNRLQDRTGTSTNVVYLPSSKASNLRAKGHCISLTSNIVSGGEKPLKKPRILVRPLQKKCRIILTYHRLRFWIYWQISQSRNGEGPSLRIQDDISKSTFF